uniref:Uncharacterized protein n=1 Tax=Loa loa TaxID=7209 RepID=A0A1I7V8V5_LOALO
MQNAKATLVRDSYQQDNRPKKESFLGGSNDSNECLRVDMNFKPSLRANDEISVSHVALLT